MASKTKDVSKVLVRTQNQGASRLAMLAGGAGTGVPLEVSEPSYKGGYLDFILGREYLPGEHVLLPLDLVIDDPLQPRVHYSDQKQQALKVSLKVHGQLEAIQVYPADRDGKFMLRSGHRRTRGLRALGNKFAKAEIVEPAPNLLERYRAARHINEEHQAPTHLDDAVRFADLLVQKVVEKQEDIAQEFGLSISHVSKCLSVGKLPAPVVSEMSQNIELFGLAAAHAVFRYWSQAGNDEVSTLKLVETVVSKKLSVRKLEAEVQARLNGGSKPSRDRALSRAVLTGPAKGELKAFEGKLVLQLTDLTEQSRAAYFTRLIGVFQEMGLHVDTATQS